MANIQELYNTFNHYKAGDLSGNQKKHMYDQLGSMKPEDIITIDDHKYYVELVQKLRQASMNDMKLFGQKFLATLKSLLSVGEDGVYMNRLRFLYELIQNVDDCDYHDISDCSLDIRFRYDQEPGMILLNYNEIGFTPENVFAITGIAEKSKNVSPDKMEIGEKGIGFKSVFGIARKVLIESGMFSFELDADNFTVPVPRYENYDPVQGTRLTLEMSAGECRGIYRSLVSQYMTKGAMLNQNPILFLNKLTHLKLYFDAFRYIEFDVQRKPPKNRGELLLETNVSISVDMKDHIDGMDRKINNEIICYRYTMPITYGRDECIARYGEDVAFSERRHNLVAVFPIISDGMDEIKGTLYSFLPTQIKINAPLILHVPYKLGGSREFVDPNDYDAWFVFTNRKLVSFLEAVYIDLAHILKRDVIRYIPSKHSHFFRGDRENIKCLLTNDLKGDYICTKNVFYTEEGTFEDIKHIVAFGKDENLKDQVEVHKLLEEESRLFVPSYPVDMRWYGCRVIEDVQGALFKHGLKYPVYLDNILTWLEKNIQDLSYYKLLYANEPIRFNAKHLSAVARHGQLWNASIQNARKQISDKKTFPLCTIVSGKPQKIDSAAKALLVEVIENADLDRFFMEYLKRIKYQFYVVANKKDFAIAADNGVVLAKGSELGSFAKLARLFDQQGTFTASIEIRQASEKLNQIDNSLSNREYLALLHGVRKSLKDAFGKRMYNSYIKIIAEAGTDKKRFLSELLQNADDCSYPKGVTPTFDMQMNGSLLTVSYNENGFSKDNVRAITAIGESTKKLLFSNDENLIGEKGVGFKSVFGVAESVEIHSNGFDFKLTDSLPTIPEQCETVKNNDGTSMIFQMKQDISRTISARRILQLCICLRNLRHLNILGHIVRITDEDQRRVIKLDSKKYVFDKVVHEFDVLDGKAIAERNINGKGIDAHQRIVCYIPKKTADLEMFLYSGLPLDIRSNVPLIIDAPFELTTSRENVLHNNWNDIIKTHLYDAIVDVMHIYGSGLEVFRFTGFRSQNNASTWQNFDDEYMNRYNWPNAIQKANILPVLGSDKKVSAVSRKCRIIPDFIARLQKNEDITRFFDGTIIDTIGKNQYTPLLEAIGCEKVNGKEIQHFLNYKVNSYIIEKDFRDGLYAYLSNNQGSTVFEGVGNYITSLPFIPVKTKGGTKYISYKPNIYTHESETSQDDFYILNTAIMSLKLADEILAGRGRINELTQDVFDAKYQKTLEECIVNYPRKYTDEQIAEYLLHEYQHNRSSFSKCRLMLLGLLPRIPFLMESGIYKKGNKFLNSRKQWYAGTLIKNLVVDSKYQELACFLECKEVETMHFDNIDFEIEDIEDDDIEDIECDFNNYYELIRGLIDEGLISDEQIAKYHLEFGESGFDNEDDLYEEFPEKPIRNISKLRKHIRDEWENQPNPYVEKTYVQWTPKYALDKTNYTIGFYGSKFNPNKCFCQMCRRLTHLKYIERNDIERNPAYAWNQMYLSLCLNCSKDYKELRYNNVIWSQFVEHIMNADPFIAGAIEIPIGGESITFTSTHLAEVQEIFKNQGWGIYAPKRKAVIESKKID